MQRGLCCCVFWANPTEQSQSLEWGRVRSGAHLLEFIRDVQFVGIEQEQYEVAPCCKPACCAAPHSQEFHNRELKEASQDLSQEIDVIDRPGEQQQQPFPRHHLALTPSI